MSHDATNWAIKQRGIKPALKVVLWNLCDRYHPDNGCFPSQDTLAADCEVSRSALNTHLDELEGRGLIAREQRRKAGSNRQERTRYRFAFEADFKAKPASNSNEKPSPESGHGDGEAESRNQAEPSPENGESRVQNLDSNLVKEPVREPVKREGVRGQGEEEQKELFDRFKALEIGRKGNSWPKVLGSSSDWGLKQFLKLTDEERILAEDRRDIYLAACPKIKSGEFKGQPNAVPIGVYLRDKKFLDVAHVVAVKPVVAEKIAVAPFGPVWAGLRALALLAGPEPIDIPLDLRGGIRSMFDVLRKSSNTRALGFLQRKGIEIDDDGVLIFPADFEIEEGRRRQRDDGFPEANRLHKLASQRERHLAESQYAALAEFCEPVPVGSELFLAWRQHDQDAGWPFIPDPGSMPVVYFPKGGPDGLHEFELAAAAAISKGRCDDHAA